jgi:hypothetical protein
VSTSRRQRWANGKRRIQRRLRRSTWELLGFDHAQPMLTARNIQYEMADRTRAIAAGGIGVMHRLARQVGLADEIDRRVHVLKRHVPYHESDHVLSIAYNVLAGGRCLEDLELRRNDEAFLDALGAKRIPDPTTAGDFCRRFGVLSIEALMTAANEARLRVWRQQPDAFFDRAVIDADGTLAPTTGERKEGMNLGYDGTWGYHPLVVSLASTQEPLYLVNRSANRPSHEGAAERFDQAVSLCRRAGFRSILLRGDTDFSQTRYLDGWDDQDVTFLFGIQRSQPLYEIAANLPEEAWRPLSRPAKYEVATKERARRPNVKEQVVVDRGFLNIRTDAERVASFEYRPTACGRSYRVVALLKNLSKLRGEDTLVDDVMIFFFITNDRTTPACELVLLANQRCNQENLHSQLKSGTGAMRMPVDTLHANWAYMVMAALAWSMKAWLALLLPESGRWAERHRSEKQRLLAMEFRTFVNAMIMLPCQIVRGARRLRYRLLSWSPWQPVLFRALAALAHPLRP